MTSRIDIPAQIRALMGAVEAPASGRRRWICATCGGEARPSLALCDKCERDAISHRRRQAVENARWAMPEGSRACLFGSQAIRERVCAGDDAGYRRAVGTAYQWSRQPEGTLLLMGQAGAGKTSLMAAAYNAVLDAGSHASSSHADYHLARNAAWTTAFDLAKARRTASLGAEAPAVATAMGATLLAIDELGAEKDGLGAEAVYEVLYARHAACKPTLYTTPLSREALAQKYGGGGERRLFERATVIHL